MSDTIDQIFRFVTPELSQAIIRILVLSILSAISGMLGTQTFKYIYDGLTKKKKKLEVILCVILDIILVISTSILIILIFNINDIFLTKLFNIIIISIFGFPLSILFYEMFGKLLFEVSEILVNKTKELKVNGQIELYESANNLLKVKILNKELIQESIIEGIVNDKKNN